MPRQYQFTAIPGIFKDHAQIAKSASDKMVRTQPDLGLLPKEYESDSPKNVNSSQWERFVGYLTHLNEKSSEGISYKLIYIVRHGTGVHNEVMKAVGDGWRRTEPNWAFREGGEVPGVGEATWVDAKLVEAGMKHAKDLSRFLLDATKDENMPLPDTIYTSPLARCLETTKLAYQEVMVARQKSFQPLVKELLREKLTGHTCDKRSSKSWIAENYPDYVIENGFEEDDRLWEKNRNPAEDDSQVTVRIKRLLGEIFHNDSSQVIALTTHSYSISAIQRTISTEPYRVGEGVMVPLLVKAELSYEPQD
ncbi:hypothetical protein LQW54_009450 [Pestalotiopsis sp. IQ-011]